MKRNPGFVLRAAMLIVDLLAIVAAFGVAYYSRVYFDARPFYFAPDIWEFVRTIVTLLPIWILVMFICGVYSESVYLYRPKIYSRMLIVSLLGTMLVISTSFLLEETIFPSRIVVAYAFVICFVFLIIGREVVNFIRSRLQKNGHMMLDAIIIGNDMSTAVLIEQLRDNPAFGYETVAVVANDPFVPEYIRDKKCRSLKQALESVRADVIIQTDSVNTDKVYSESVERHMEYIFIPSQEILLSHVGKLRIIGSQPMISVRTTPLVGWARLVKRIADVVFGIFFFIVALLPMVVIPIAVKISDPRGRVLFSEKRLTRYGQKCKIYKFRSIKAEYNGMTPEEAFAKMGKPELSKEYRANGDQIKNDPRVTKIGKILRRTSLDELPQLWNVVRGDISLVGPRSLQPGELEKYPNRNLILSTKSGLTGLAQVSGRRNISFEERRSLDIYYIQNWSLALDTQIILRTILMVLIRRGAK